jgi:hypothetical protein
MKSDKQRAGSAAGVQSIVNRRAHGVVVPYTTETRCFVCTSEYRYAIERGVVLEGKSYPQIGKSLPGHALISPRSIGSHCRSHLFPILRAIGIASPRSVVERDLPIVVSDYEMNTALRSLGEKPRRRRRTSKRAIALYESLVPRASEPIIGTPPS